MKSTLMQTDFLLWFCKPTRKTTIMDKLHSPSNERFMAIGMLDNKVRLVKRGLKNRWNLEHGLCHFLKLLIIRIIF